VTAPARDRPLNKWGRNRTKRNTDLARKIPNLPPGVVLLFEALDQIVTSPAGFPELRFPGMKRERRIERLEAICVAYKAMAVRMDAVSWRVGLPADNGYLQGLPVDSPEGTTRPSLTAWTGITRSRLERGIADGMRAGYQLGKRDKRGRLCAPQPRELDIDEATGERSWKGYPAVRKFDRLLFKRLGIATRMDELTEEESKQRRKEAREAREQQEKERAAAAARELERLAALADAKRSDYARTPRISDAPSPLPADATTNSARRWNEIAIQVRGEHPDWPADSVRAEVTRRLGTGPPE